MRGSGTCRCYAFRSAKGGECLGDHLRGVAECARGRWETRGLARKLSTLYGVSEELVEDLVTLAGALHDVGKSCAEYQQNCREVCEEFPDHYVPSAQLSAYIGRLAGLDELSADRMTESFDLVLLEELGDLKAGYLYILAVVVPVLSHHYAQINLARLPSKGMRTELLIHGECVEELRTTFVDLEGVVKTELARRLVATAYTLITRGGGSIGDLPVIHLKREHLFNTRKPPPQRFIVDAVLGVLNLCDGLVASRSR
jgi:CRISPR-associated endonuclease Cas3-HD